MSGQFNRIFGAETARASETEQMESEAEVTIAACEGEAQATPPTPAVNGEYMTFIGAGSTIEGKIICSGPTRFGGDVNGEIVGDGVVVIDEGASVAASVSAGEAVIGGRINGDVIAKSRVSLSATARIEGDIQTPSLMIEEGALVKGNVDVAPQSSRERETPRLDVVQSTVKSVETRFASADSADAPFPT